MKKERKPKIQIDAFREVLTIVEKSAKAPEYSDNKVFDYTVWFDDLTTTHKTVADVIKHPCGTQACIGGWGNILALSKTETGLQTITSMYSDSSDPLYDEELAMEFFGITPDEADYLFYGHWHRSNINAPIVDVIAKLRNIIETGKVKNLKFDRSYKK